MITEGETAAGNEANAIETGIETGEEASEGEGDITEVLGGVADRGAHRGEEESEIDEVSPKITTSLFSWI